MRFTGMTMDYTKHRKSPDLFMNRTNVVLQTAAMNGIISSSIFERSDELNSRFRNPDEMRDLYIQIDNEISSRITAGRIKPLCGEKCSECCSFSFAVTRSEYLLIREHLRQNGTNTSGLKAAAENQLSMYESLCPEDYKRYRYGTNEETLDEMSAKRFLPCVFLKNGNCSIYPVRPLICRIFGVTYGNLYDAQCKRILRHYLRPRIRTRALIELKNRIMLYIPQYDEMTLGLHYVTKAQATATPPFTELTIEYSRALPLFWWLAEDNKTSVE